MDDTKLFTVYLITCIQKQTISVRKESDWHLYSKCMCGRGRKGGMIHPIVHLRHVPKWKFSTNLVRNWEQNKVIHGSWHLISLPGLPAVHLGRPLMHTCAVMFRRLVFIRSRERKPPITHTEMKAWFTNTSCRHTFIIFLMVDLSRADPSPSLLFEDYCSTRNLCCSVFCSRPVILIFRGLVMQKLLTLENERSSTLVALTLCF